jgi:isopentenyl-diphosphate delta-isomerase
LVQQPAVDDEVVVLCDPSGAAIGTQSKASVHHADTPLHLAFSCYVFDRSGWLLVSRRAASKRTWPSVRTNSCCGHPLPGESMIDAITRRLRGELGIAPAVLDLILPGFSYRATMANGVVENELCPVYRAITDSRTVAPDPGEVAEAWWDPWAAFVDAGEPADPRSPWSVEQVAALGRLGPDPLRWPVADSSLLPAAASI